MFIVRGPFVAGVDMLIFAGCPPMCGRRSGVRGLSHAGSGWKMLVDVGGTHMSRYVEDFGIQSARLSKLKTAVCNPFLLYY